MRRPININHSSITLSELKPFSLSSSASFLGVPVILLGACSIFISNCKQSTKLTLINLKLSALSEPNTFVKKLC